MSEEKERELYWQAVECLNEIINSGNKDRAEILEELDDDLA